MSAEIDNLSEALSAHIDGELAANQQAELANLLAADNTVTVKLEAMKSSMSVFQAGQSEIQSKCPDLWAGISQKLPPICQVVEEDFSAYLDGELIAPAKEGVSEHLQACSPCHTKFQNLSSVNSLLSRGLAVPNEINIDLWSKLSTRLDEDCALIREELSSFYDREVTPVRHRTVTSHLLECSPCRNQLSSITRTSESLRTYYQPELPEDFDIWPQIKTKIQVLPFNNTKEKRRKTILGRRLYLTAAAVCAGVLAASTLFVNFHSASTIQPVTAESYLIESALGEPSEAAEAMVYENQ